MTVNCTTGQREFRDWTREEIYTVENPDRLAKIAAEREAEAAELERIRLMRERVQKLGPSGEVSVVDLHDAVRAMAELAGVELTET